MRRASVAERYQIIGLKENGRITNAAISAQLGIPISTIKDVWRRYREDGSVKDRPRSGRPRKSSQRQDRSILRMARRNRVLSSARLRGHWMRLLRHPISSTTVRHRLRRGGYRACRPVQKPVLSEQHRQVCNWNKPSFFIAIHRWYILYCYVSSQIYIYFFIYFRHVSSGPGRGCGTTCGISAASTSRMSHHLSWGKLMDGWGYGGDETRPTTQTASYQRDDQVESLFRCGDVSRMTASSLCCVCKVAWLASATGMRCWLQLSIPI